MRACQLSDQDLQSLGNPTGTQKTYPFIMPNHSLLGHPAGAAGSPAAQPNNVQVSLSDGKSTAMQQLQVLHLACAASNP